MDYEIFDEEWLRRTINEANQEKLNENKVKEEHRALTPEQLKEYGITFFDGKEYDEDTIARALWRIIKKINKEGETPNDFYCGITNDIVSRKSAHESEDYDGKEIKRLFAIKCDSFETAAKVEEIMDERHHVSRGKTKTFGNGGKSDSDYVYVYRIPK